MGVGGEREEAAGTRAGVPDTGREESSMTRPWHPATKIFPLMSEVELRALADDIAAHGLIVPIETHQGLVLDGRHRDLACEMVQVKARYRAAALNGMSPTEYVVTENFHRRHLTPDQRAIIALEVLPLFEAEAKKRQRLSKGPGRKGSAIGRDLKGKAAAKVAAQFGVSERYVEMAKKIRLCQPELLHRVMVGMPLRRAYREAAARRRQDEVERKRREGEQLSDDEMMSRLGIKLQVGDSWTFNECEPGYGKEYPGRIPAGLVFNFVYYFTEPGHLVVDPMAGGGTVLDVCKAMGRECVAFDVDPSRRDIQKHDLRAGWPDIVADADHVFWDPPWFSEREDEYGPDSISRLPRGEYLKFFDEAIGSVPPKFDGAIAFLMGDHAANNPADSIWWWHYAWMFEKHGWRALRRVQCPMPQFTLDDITVANALRSRGMVRRTRDLVVWERA